MGDSIVIIVDGVQSRLNVVRREPDGSWATTDYPLPGQRRAMPERGRAFLEAEMVDWALDDSPRLDEIVIPDSVTAWAGVEVAPDGDLWLLKGGPYLEDGPSAQQWVKWSFDAGIVDTLTAPSGDEVLWFGSDYIVTRRKGDLDVESLRLYRLISTGQ